MRALVLGLGLGLALGCQGTGDQAPILRVTDDPAVTDCDALAETLAQVEIGDYAPRAYRDRVVARERGACEAAALTPREAVCVGSATSREAAERCSPRLQLDVECDAAIAALRAGLQHAAASYAAQLERNVAVMAKACDEDDWPIAVKRCLIAAGTFPACADKLPHALQRKLAQRVAAEWSR